jgi:hypothetical protein
MSLPHICTARSREGFSYFTYNERRLEYDSNRQTSHDIGYEKNDVVTGSESGDTSSKDKREHSQEQHRSAPNPGTFKLCVVKRKAMYVAWKISGLLVND